MLRFQPSLPFAVALAAALSACGTTPYASASRASIAPGPPTGATVPSTAAGTDDAPSGDALYQANDPLANRTAFHLHDDVIPELSGTDEDANTFRAR